MSILKSNERDKRMHRKQSRWLDITLKSNFALKIK